VTAQRDQAPAEPDWRAAWQGALAELELDVEAAEAMLAAARLGADLDPLAGLGSWTPPEGIGALPESLRERAEIVMERQLRVIEDVANAAVRSRQHLELGRRMQPDQAPARPLYVDAAC
jgi:hypothetical protein